MGFFKKFTKKMGRVVTSKSKTTRGLLTVGAVVAAPLIIGGTAAAIFGSRSVMGNSEQSTPEETGWSGGYAPEDLNRLRSDTYQQGLFVGRQAIVAAGAGAATGGGACAAPLVLEAVCKLCGGG